MAKGTVSAVVLVGSALAAQLWGFVVLNVVWAGASAWGLVHHRVHAEDVRDRSTPSS